MAKFLTSNELNSELEKLMDQAEDRIILVSPYIKLHERYQSVLKTKLNKPKLEIILVFGKNEDDISRSMKQEDFNFFKEFPNVQIRYEKRLHAKYFANEKEAILTSMNLYSYSQDNNIEMGVKTKTSKLANLASNLVPDIVGEEGLDTQASLYFQRVIDQSNVLFQKKPQFDGGAFGTGLGKKYISSEIETDELSVFFSNNSGYKSASWRKSKATSKSILKPTSSKPKYESRNPTGYCIRTGKEIPFNPEKPMSYEAFKNWNRFGDRDYKEQYCHFSGKKSNGKTTTNKPILNEYWREAKDVFAF